MKEKNVSFLEPFLVDPEVLNWDPGSKASDLAKKTVDVLKVIKEDPGKLKERDIESMIWDKKSQIINKDKFYSHILNVGILYHQLCENLLFRCPDLDLPEPNTAKAFGLIHDLSKIYSKHDNIYKNEDCELTLYFHARHLGLDIISNKVAMHEAYFEILEMIKDGSGFQNVNLYKDWTYVLNDPDNPLFFDNINSFFDGFLKGKENLPLISLSVIDNIENGNSNFSIESFDEDFKIRIRDIINRYYLNLVLDSKEPLALGVALIKKGGLERNVNYKNIVLDLLRGNFDKYEGKFFL